MRRHFGHSNVQRRRGGELRTVAALEAAPPSFTPRQVAGREARSALQGPPETKAGKRDSTAALLGVTTPRRVLCGRCQQKLANSPSLSRVSLCGLPSCLLHTLRCQARAGRDEGGAHRRARFSSRGGGASRASPLAAATRGQQMVAAAPELGRGLERGGGGRPGVTAGYISSLKKFFFLEPCV